MLEGKELSIYTLNVLHLSGVGPPQTFLSFTVLIWFISQIMGHAILLKTL